MEKTICKNCIMTENEDPTIFFNEKGVCNYCLDFKIKDKQRRLEKQELPWVIHKMKKEKGYHCLLGLSGGVDSSYCLHLLVEQGIKPLCFSVDNGWQTPEAQENIMRMVEGLKVPYYRYNIDVERFRELQATFIASGLKNIEIPTDHILMAATYEMASKYGIKNIISGGNLATEGIMPEHFGYSARDLTHLRGVYEKKTKKPLRNLPTISLIEYLWYRFIKKIKIINLLDYYEYDREKSIKLLQEKYGYKPYGEKHGESEFTKWFQGWYLPYKFKLDKRVPHYSSMINSGQMTREEALELLKERYELKLPHLHKNGVELGLEESSKEYLDIPIKDYKDYPNSEYWWNLLSKLYKCFK